MIPLRDRIRTVCFQSISAPAKRPFRLASATLAVLAMASAVWAQPGFFNNSSILGDQNLARTKDADVADINNDGFLDILDSNSNNQSNNTQVVVRFSNGAAFTTHIVGPRDNTVSYDSDLVDLNGDNLPDLIRTESPGGSIRRIAVYRNLGGADGKWFDLANPTYSAPLDLCPDDIEFGHLNSDGRIDFAVSERIGNICATQDNQMSHISVFLGTGTGLTFTKQAVRLPASNNTGADQSTHDVFFLKANADDAVDIFAVNEGGVNGRLWLNNGASSPTFTVAPTTFPTAFAGKAADFNGDGRDDFVLGGGNSATVFLNVSSPSTPGVAQFSSTSLSNTSAGSFYDMELGDLDLDGDIDIVGVTIAGGSSGQARIWLNQNNQGTFAPFGGANPLPGHVNNQRLSADLIDYDNDGDPDLYVTGGDGQNLGCFGCVPNQFFENQLHRHGRVHYWPMSGGVRQGGIDIHRGVSVNWTLKGAGDVNGDGTDDVIWQHKNGQVHYWPMNDGARQGGIDIHTPVGVDWNLSGVGDVDGNGTDDIIWQHKSGQVHYWPMSGGVRQGGRNIHTPVGVDWNLMGVGDLNGNGSDDIVWQHESGQVHAWSMSGGVRQGSFNIHTPVGVAWNLEDIGDVNGDGTDDVIWQHQNGQVHAWLMSGGVRQRGVGIYTPVGPSWGLKAVGDVNGDGTDDIVWQANGNGTDDIVWQHQNGQVHFWPMARGERTGGVNVWLPVGKDWALKGSGDVDGDGNADVIWQHESGQVHYWPMDHGKRAGGVNIHTPVSGDWRLRGIGDLNGDQTDDIVWQHRNGQVHYWPMERGKRTGGIDIHTPVGSDWLLRGVGDVNGDETDDIVWRNRNGQVHYWPIKRGERVGGINIHTPVSSAWELCGVGDVNGDRTEDIIWQRNDGQVHYWPMERGRRTGGINIHAPVGSDWRFGGVGDLR